MTVQLSPAKEPINPAAILDKRDYLFTWIASYPKSGNTWVRAFLTAYRRGELDLEALEGVADSSPTLYQAVAPQRLDRMLAKEKMLLRPAALLHLHYQCLLHRKKRPLVKSHCLFGMVQGIELVPHCLCRNYVYVVRDPRDVACSFSHHRGKSLEETVRDMGTSSYSSADREIPHVLGSWSEHVQSWAQEGVLVVRYEDLIADPAAGFMRILDHVEDGFLDGERFDYAMSVTEFSNMAAMEEQSGFLEARPGRKFFRSGKPGAWEDELPSELARRIEQDHGEQMAKWGYV